MSAHFGYDAAGRRISVTSARGTAAGDVAFTTTVEYDSEYGAQITGFTNPLGHRTGRQLDSLGVNIVRETDANVNTIEKKYDPFGEIKEIIEAGDDWTKRIFVVNAGNPTAQYIEVQYRQNTNLGYDSVLSIVSDGITSV